MASFYYLIAMVFLLCCSTTMFTQENPTVQPGNNTFVGCKINRKASTNNSTVCNLYVDNEQSKIGELLRIQHKPTTNIIKLKIFVVSENETRCFTKMEWPWANEIGRTIISLIWLAKKTIFTSPIFTMILEVGTEEVAIQIKEKTDGCLPPGDEGSDRIFEFLLHRLLHSKGPDVYKLCRKSTHHAMYNCCRIVGDRNLTVCADYSSIVVKLALPAVIVVFSISFFLVLPFVLEHIITYPTIKFYKTSDSPMSLTSVVSMMFFESRGRAKSLFRRGVFAGLSSMVFLHDFFGSLWLKALFYAWTAFFVVTYDIQMTYEECEQECLEECKKENIEECEKKCIRKPWDKNIISCFTIPFSLPFYSSWSKGKCCQGSIWEYLKDLGCGIAICIFMIFYFLICFPLLVLACLTKITFELALSFIWPHGCSAKGWVNCLLILMRLLTLPNIVFVMSMILIFALFMVVGLTLNAEFFNPFVAPIFTLVVYFWKNWKSSVEAKCLQLKTSIIEVCKEKAPSKQDEQNSENPSINGVSELTGKDRIFDFLCSCVRDTSSHPHTWKSFKNLRQRTCLQQPRSSCSNSLTNLAGSAIEDNENAVGNVTVDHVEPSRSDENKAGNENPGGSNIETPPGSGDNADGSINERGKQDDELITKDIIKFDKRGEAMISKELYEKISKEILPLDHLVFYFFRRVIFVGFYAFVMFTVMIISRESGVSESVQIISAIAGVLIPFIFDTIFADHHISVRTSKNLATKERLEHILKVKRENNTIFVELVNININNDKSKKNEGNQTTSGC